MRCLAVLVRSSKVAPLTCSAGVHHPGLGEFVLQLQHRQARLGGLGRADGTNVFGFVTLVIDDLQMFG